MATGCERRGEREATRQQQRQQRRRRREGWTERATSDEKGRAGSTTHSTGQQWASALSLLPIASAFSFRCSRSAVRFRVVSVDEGRGARRGNREIATDISDTARSSCTPQHSARHEKAINPASEDDRACSATEMVTTELERRQWINTCERCREYADLGSRAYFTSSRRINIRDVGLTTSTVSAQLAECCYNINKIYALLDRLLPPT